MLRSQGSTQTIPCTHTESDNAFKVRLKRFKQFLRKERRELPIDSVSGTSGKKGKSITIEINVAVPPTLLSESTRALNTQNQFN